MRALASTVAILAMLVAGTAGASEHAPGQQKRKAKGEAPAASESVRGAAERVFSDAERSRILGYYERQGTIGKPLPPGIAKNLARGKPLPPGIAKRYPPRDLAQQLPRRSAEEIIVSGAKAILVDVATGVILDILDIVRGKKS